MEEKEKYDIESAEDLDSIINSIKTNTFIDMENKSMLELENANLKNKLAELKQQLAVKEKKHLNLLASHEMIGVGVNIVELSLITITITLSQKQSRNSLK